jgi:hypothetical protein
VVIGGWCECRGCWLHPSQILTGDRDSSRGSEFQSAS